MSSGLDAGITKASMKGFWLPGTRSLGEMFSSICGQRVQALEVARPDSHSEFACSLYLWDPGPVFQLSRP